MQTLREGKRTWQHSGARTPNLLNFLAPTGAAIQSALCTPLLTLPPAACAAQSHSARNVMKQSFIKIHYLFNTQVASPSYLPPTPLYAPVQKANKINLRLRRTENKSQRQRGPHLLARGVGGYGVGRGWSTRSGGRGVYNCHVNVTFIMLFLWFTRRGNILQPKAAKKA